MRQNRRNHAAGSLAIGRELRRNARRRFHQGIARFVIAHDVHEALHGIGIIGEMGEAGGLERFRSGPVLADPGRAKMRARKPGANRSTCCSMASV